MMRIAIKAILFRIIESYLLGRQLLQRAFMVDAGEELLCIEDTQSTRRGFRDQEDAFGDE